jgi:hypothetical protein
VQIELFAAARREKERRVKRKKTQAPPEPAPRFLLSELPTDLRIAQEAYLRLSLADREAFLAWTTEAPSEGVADPFDSISERAAYKIG